MYKFMSVNLKWIFVYFLIIMTYNSVSAQNHLTNLSQLQNSVSFQNRLTSLPHLAYLLRPAQVISALQGVNIFDDLIIRRASTNISTPTLEQTMYYEHYASASLCNNPALSSWTCQDCLATGPDVKLLKIFEYPRNYIQGFIAINNLAKEIVLSFRAGTTFINYARDFTFEQIHIPGGTGNMMVHKGGWFHWLSLKDQVTKELRNALVGHTNYNVTIVGASFAGIVSTMVLFGLKNIPEFATLQYSLYTYGSQRAGNLDFVLWLKSQKITGIRVVFNTDPIAHTYPSSIGYVHHLRELWIHGDQNIFCSNDVLEDPNCSNSLGPAYNPVDHIRNRWNTSSSPTDCINGATLISYLFPTIWAMSESIAAASNV